MQYRNPLIVPGQQVVRQQTPYSFNPLLGIGAQLGIQAAQQDSVVQAVNILKNPNTWFNVVAVIIGVLFVVIGSNAIARKSA